MFKPLVVTQFFSTASIQMGGGAGQEETEIR